MSAISSYRNDSESEGVIAGRNPASGAVEKCGELPRRLGSARSGRDEGFGRVGEEE